MAEKETIYEGTVKSFNVANGFGFIDCADTNELYGCDVFLHKSEGENLGVGTRVTFQVHLNKKGQPQANNVAPTSHVQIDRSKPDFAAGYPGLLGPFLGTVKSNNPRQGYGFITCEETQVLYNADVYLNKEEGYGLEPGQQVYFQVQSNEKGQPQAVGVSAVGRKRPLEKIQEIQPVGRINGGNNNGYRSGSGGWNKGGSSGGWNSGGWNSSRWNSGGMAAIGNGTSGPFQGWVKSFNPSQGYGFIRCDKTLELYGQDVFLHQNEASGLSEGMQVSFHVHLNAKKQPQANSVTALGGPTKRQRTGASGKGPAVPLHELPLFPEGPFAGTVKSFNPTSGYGFITCAETMALFGHDVFLYRTQAQGLEVGSQVSFQVRLNSQGQPQADNVSQTT